jgi:PKD repeat protein
MSKVLSMRTALVAAVMLTAACTIKETPTPPLTGPSEFALSLSMAAVPDLLTRDGWSQSTVVVTVRDPQGAPVRSAQLRLDITVNGQVQDFGSLSTKTLFTGPDGRATATYTAPPPPPQGASAFADAITLVASPIGTNAQGMRTTSADIRLVLPTTTNPDAPVAIFSFSPSSPGVLTLVAFNASGSYPVTGSRITNYAWDWGDGTVDNFNANPNEDHDWAGPGIYFVTLTVTDDLGQRGSTTQTIVVG